MKSAPLSLIETLHFDPAEGFRHLERHRARLTRSAAALGLPLSEPQLEETLVRVPDHLGPLRVRLELLPDGTLTLTHAPFTPLAEGQVWRVALAATRLRSSDPLLRHKTSRRDIYNTARAEIPASEADEVLLLNERGAVCEGSFTSLFLKAPDGTWLTPPLSDGLLAGILREQLLDEGKAREQSLTPSDLAAHPLFVGNSLRGLIPARLVKP